MRRARRRAPALGVAVAALALLGVPGTALGDHEMDRQIQPDVTKLSYRPIGHFKPGDPLPAANAFGTAIERRMEGRRFNPSGFYNAFDTNVFEVLALPFRGSGDEFDDDPYGNGGDPHHGRCGGDPRSDRPRHGTNGYPDVAGECMNHQREYVEYFERTMGAILVDYGVTFRRYEFFNPTQGSARGAAGVNLPDSAGIPLVDDNTFGGRAINPAAIVPGAEHPEQTVVIGAHYDKTNDGPASAWDSQEGHAQVIRVAKLMADYWRRTGTRPAATIKFIPWDAEESGTLGSEFYAENIIPPGDEELKVRGYWNTDPCAGGYPAFRYGNPADRVQLGIQLANPRRADDLEGINLNDPNLEERYWERINRFNEAAPGLVEEVFEHLDDTLKVGGVERPIFVATSEATATTPSDIGDSPLAGVRVGTSRPFLFSSDWRNFEARGIPFFNPGPEITGPGSQGDSGSLDAVVILHSPLDNLQTLNAYTGSYTESPVFTPRPDGNVMSEGWMKGMEMCSHLLAWGMLQPTQGGAIKRDDRVIPYYEALPNEAAVGEPVNFDARGTHQVINGRRKNRDLDYRWDFGDGETGTGRVAYHRYARTGTYESKLTVTNEKTGQSATMGLPITVVATPTAPLPPPSLDSAPARDEDGTFDLGFSVSNVPSTIRGWEVLEARNYSALVADDAEDPIDDRWAVSQPTHETIEPWQASDSGTVKLRRNQAASGARSYWTGVQPQRFAPGANVSGNNLGVVQSGQSALTLDEAIQVPADGSPILTFNTIFQNEGDDAGHVQVAVVGEGAEEFRTVHTLAATNTGAGDTDSFICDPSQPSTYLSGFLQRQVDMSEFRGKRIKLRFLYVLGPDNRAISHPCGWYVDDVNVTSGTFERAGSTSRVTEAGQVFAGTFTVKKRRAGKYAYRVRALYAPGDFGGPLSNLGVVDVAPGWPNR